MTEKKPKECITCKNLCIPLTKKSRKVKSLLSDKGGKVFSTVNQRPNTKFHSNIITKSHTENFRNLTLQAWNDILPVLQDSINYIENYYSFANKPGPLGYRINTPVGELAGQNVPYHFYMRVVPKYMKNRGTVGSELRMGKKANPEQVKNIQEALQPNSNEVITETNRLIAKLHSDIGFIAISTKAKLPNDIQAMDAETWAEIYEICQKIMKKIEDKGACYDFNVRWELGEKAKKAWREEAEIPSTYDYADSEFVIDLFPRYKLQRWWNEGREEKNGEQVGEMENERIAEKLRDPKAYCQKWGKKAKKQVVNSLKAKLAEREIPTPKPNYAAWIGLGIGGVALVGIIAYFFMRKKKTNN